MKMTDEQRQRIEDNAKGVEKKRLNKMKELLRGRKEQEIHVPPSFDDYPDEWYKFALQSLKLYNKRKTFHRRHSDDLMGNCGVSLLQAIILPEEV